MGSKIASLLFSLSSFGIIGLIQGVAYNVNARGHEAREGEFPWQVSLLDPITYSEIDHGCGGIIISKSWVLTTVACATFATDGEILPKIVAGTRVVGVPGTYHTVSEVINHPDYSDSNGYITCNVALLKMDDDFFWDVQTAPIGLVDFSVQPNKLGSIAGWGLTHFRGSDSVNLRVASMPVTTSEDCQMQLEKEGRGLSPDQFCAGYIGGGIAACSGDAGGPFVIYNGTDYLLAGIITLTFCTENGRPTLITDVFYHRDWIRSITGI